MNYDHFSSLHFRFLRCLSGILLTGVLISQGTLAQTQSGSDSPGGDTNRSWKSTTQQQLPGTTNPTRSSESHTETGGRTVDTQSVEHMGMYGRYEPYQDVQKETVRVNATTTRSIERTFGRDSDGRKTLIQVTEGETRSLPGGAVKVVRTTSNPDVNGGLQIVQREIQDTRQISPNVQETKSTLLTPSINGGMVASRQTEERQTKVADHNVEFRKSTLLPDLNGTLQLSEVREGTVKDDGKNRTTEERVLRPGSDGNLSVVERTVGKESENATGERRGTVESYATDVPGGDGRLSLEQRVTTIRRKDQNGTQSTEVRTEQQNPGQPSDGLRLTEKAIDIVRPGVNGASRSTQTIQSLDSNGNLNVVSVDTGKQENTSAIHIDIAPAKPSQSSPAR